MDRDSLLEKMAHAAAVVAEAVGDENLIGQATEMMVDFSQQILGLISGVEKGQLLVGLEHPCVHMTAAEGESKSVDLRWKVGIGTIGIDGGVGIRIKAERDGDFMGEGFVELPILKTFKRGRIDLCPTSNFLGCQRVADHRFAQDVGEVVLGHFHAHRVCHARGGVNSKTDQEWMVARGRFPWMMGGG